MPFSMNVKNLFSGPEPSVSEKSTEGGAQRIGQLFGSRPDPTTAFIDALLGRVKSDREASYGQELFGTPKSENLFNSLLVGKQMPNLEALKTYGTLAENKAKADAYSGGTGVYKFNPLTGQTELVQSVPKGSIVRNSMGLEDYGIKNRFDRGAKLFENFQNQPTAVEYQKFAPAVAAAEELVNYAKNNPNANMLAVDQGIITTFNKTLDPTSVVRESEYLRSTMDAPLFNRWQAAVNRIGQGGRLTQSDREAILIGLKTIAEKRGENYNQMYDQYAQIAGEAGVDPKVYLGERFKGFGTTKTQSTPLDREAILAELARRKQSNG